MSSLLISEQFVKAYPSLIRALNGDAIAALTLQAINFRSNITKPNDAGELWVDLRIPELADEIGISVAQTQRALQRLRDKSLLVETQAPGYNNKKLWKIDEDGLAKLEENAPKNIRERITNSAPANNYKCDIEESSTIKEDIRTLKETTRTYGSEIHSACNLLADLIEANGSRRPAVNDKWLSDMERLHKIDERSWEQITKAIEWCQADDFWRGNILSPAKLRKQYDQLRLAAQRSTKQSKFSKTMDWLNNLENETKELGQ